jgi:hypothetical protein
MFTANNVVGLKVVNPLKILQYDKEKGAFRTPDLNYIIAVIARLTGDSAIMKKGLTAFLSGQSLSAGCWLQLSNLKPLSDLADSRLRIPVSPHKISSDPNVNISDNLTRDLIAINEFMNTIEL